VPADRVGVALAPVHRDRGQLGGALTDRRPVLRGSLVDRLFGLDLRGFGVPALLVLVIRGVELGEEPIGGGLPLALAAPDQPAAAVIADQRQVAVALSPRDLVDRDLKQIAEPVAVQQLGATRSLIRPIVCQSIRVSRQVAVLSVLVASQATRLSKSRVNRAPARANGTPSTRTPCTGQRSRLRRAWTASRHTPRARCRQSES
jgi:hypothetical protein